MPHNFGALQLPALPPLPDEAVTDKARTILLAFFQSILTNCLRTAWAYVAPGEPVVRTTHPWNPERYDFRHNDLPAIYCYRTRIQGAAVIADSVMESRDVMSLLWVYPPAKDYQAAKHEPIFNGIVKTALFGLKRGRHPSWVHPDDSEDDYASAHGSSLLEHCGFARIAIEGVTGEHSLSALMVKDQAYPGILITIPVEEWLTEDTSEGRYSPALHLKTTTAEPDEDDAFLFNERIRPDPPEEEP